MQLADFEMIEKADIPGGYQCVLEFGDHYQLSIITGVGAHGNEDAPYEIAVIKHGDLVEMPGITAEGDTVRGCLTEADVSAIIKKMHTITTRIPRQI